MISFLQRVVELLQSIAKSDSPYAADAQRLLNEVTNGNCIEFYIQRNV
jgi:hypothetical protein